MHITSALVHIKLIVSREEEKNLRFCTFDFIHHLDSTQQKSAKVHNTHTSNGSYQILILYLTFWKTRCYVVVLNQTKSTIFFWKNSQAPYPHT